jgi:hypothetical protein
MKVSVPAGTTATVYVPAAAGERFVATHGTATPTGRVDGYQVFAVAPGDVTFQQGTSSGGTVGGSVPATLSLTLGAAPAFGAFTPGVARTSSASTTATVTSTAGDAALTVVDPSPTSPGHLVNGAFGLVQPLQVGGAALSGSPATVKTWAAPVSNDAVALSFQQAIGANEALRTGGYAKTLIYTLSTTTP